MPYAIGTIGRHNISEADTLGNDPESTTFASVDAARAAIQSLIDNGCCDPDVPITNAAIQDTETGRIVWRQGEDE